MHKRVPHTKNCPVRNTTSTSIKKLHERYQWIPKCPGEKPGYHPRSLPLSFPPFTQLSCQWVLLIISPKYFSNQYLSLCCLYWPSRCPLVSKLGWKLYLAETLPAKCPDTKKISLKVFIEWMSFNSLYCFLFLSQSEHFKMHVWLDYSCFQNLHLFRTIFKVKSNTLLHNAGSLPHLLASSPTILPQETLLQFFSKCHGSLWPFLTLYSLFHVSEIPLLWVVDS